MNIFEHRDSFFGSPDARITDGSLIDFFHVAKQIRSQLGKQGYLLDCYLLLFFEGAANTTSFESADDGYLAGGEFQTLLFSLIDGSDAKKGHQLYPRMREAYGECSGELCFQERYTRLCLLLFPLADELLAEAAARFQEEQVHRLDGVVDEIRMLELYEHFCSRQRVHDGGTQSVAEAAVPDRASYSGIHAGTDQRSGLQAGRPRPRNQPSDVPALFGRPAGDRRHLNPQRHGFIIFRKRRMQGCNVLRPLHPYILGSGSGSRQNQRSPCFSDRTPRFFFAIISVRRETPIPSALF